MFRHTHVQTVCFSLSPLPFFLSFSFLYPENLLFFPLLPDMKDVWSCSYWICERAKQLHTCAHTHIIHTKSYKVVIKGSYHQTEGGTVRERVTEKKSAWEEQERVFNKKLEKSTKLIIPIYISLEDSYFQNKVLCYLKLP